VEELFAMPYLLKTEPGEYSFDDLKRDCRTKWEGVTNPTAVRNLREMKAGEDVIIYHTGSERRAVGTAKVISVDASDPKVPIVVIQAQKPLNKPVSLDEIKSTRLFRDSPLLKIGRLSVVPLTEAQFEFLRGEAK
jgi:predicted RNA-binding protein with PUA-like domain